MLGHPFACPKGLTGWAGALISEFIIGLMQKKTQLPSDMGSLFLCACVDPQKLAEKKSPERKESMPARMLRVKDQNKGKRLK